MKPTNMERKASAPQGDTPPAPLNKSEQEILQRHAEHYVAEYVRNQKQLKTKAPAAAVYRHYSASGELLYVGLSANPLRRSSEHMNGTAFRYEVATIKIEWYKTYEEAAKAESSAIKRENPKHNAVGR